MLPGARSPPGAGRRARDAGPRPSAARAATCAAHARAVPLGPSSRRAVRIPGCSPHARRRAGTRAERVPAATRAGDSRARPESTARIRSESGASEGPGSRAPCPAATAPTTGRPGGRAPRRCRSGDRVRGCPQQGGDTRSGHGCRELLAFVDSTSDALVADVAVGATPTAIAQGTMPTGSRTPTATWSHASTR